MIEHLTIEANGASFHVARAGNGPPLLLLHGWPEFWLTWDLVMQRLSDRFTLIAPDLRGFGDSDKPTRLWAPADHAADMLAVLDALGLERVGLVGHDIGGAVMQALAREAPDHFTGLFFFDFSYPGIGSRGGTPDRLIEIWYQFFHQLEIAPILVGANRDTCRAYFGFILRHWAHRSEVFDDAVLEVFVDNFMKPGNLEGGFNHYKAGQVGRMALLKGEAPALPPIAIPTTVRWAEHDALFPFGFTDRLGETFTNLDLAMFEGVGHFPHREDPDRAAAEIAAFFERIG